MRGYLKTAEGETFEYTDEQGKIDCFRCGYCCVAYNPRVDEEEVARMSDFLDVTPQEFRRRYIQETLVGSLVRQAGEGCVFVEWDKDSFKSGCRIHPARPDACRDWQSYLDRIECCRGLAEMGDIDRILPVTVLYDDPVELQRFCRVTRER